MTERHYVVTLRAVQVARIKVRAASEAEARSNALEQVEHGCEPLSTPERVYLTVEHAREVSRGP